MRCTVAVKNGLFNVNLDFDAVFDGNERYLELSVAQAENCDPTTDWSTLAPLQRISATPYALYSLVTGDADRLDGLDSSDFLSTTGGSINGDLHVFGTTHFRSTSNPVGATFVSFRQACMTAAEASAIVGCLTTHAWRTADEAKITPRFPRHSERR